MLLPIGGAAVVAQTPPGGLPAGLSGKSSLSGAEEAAIEQFLTSQVSGLSGQNGAAGIRTARTAVMAPLSANTTVNFRLVYGRVLREKVLPGLTGAGQKNDQVVANALRIAGETASTTTAPFVLDAMKDARPPVRFAGVTAAGRMLELTGKGQSALNPSDLTGVIKAVGEFVGTAEEASLVDGGVVALAAGVAIAPKAGPGLEQVSSASMSALATGLSTRLTKPDGEVAVPATLRAMKTTRDALTAGAAGGQVLSAQAMRDGAAMAGDTLRLLMRLEKEGKKHALHDQLVGASVTVVTLSATLLDANLPAVPTDPGKIIGQGGALTKPPFNFPADRFN